MKRYWLANSSETPPTPPEETVGGYPQDGNLALNHKPTKVGAWWYHMMTEEFMNVIERAGLEPSYENLHQLADIFDDFKQRATGAETFKNQAKAEADRAEAAASQVVTDVDSAVQTVQAAAQEEIEKINDKIIDADSSVNDGINRLQQTLNNLVANLENVGGEQASYVRAQAQSFVDDIRAELEGYADRAEAAAQQAAESQVQADWAQTDTTAKDFIKNKPPAPSVMTGATATADGVAGLVTKPLAGDENKVLKGDGTWGNISGVPVGTIMYFSANEAPAGFLVCNGALVGRSTYPELFAVIGWTYTAEVMGQYPANQFQLPNLIDKFAQGSTTVGTVKSAGLPNIVGTFMGGDGRQDYFSGAFEKIVSASKWGGSTYPFSNVTFDASRSSSIYGSSDTVQPPALTLLPCIKAFGATTNEGLVDVTSLANEVTALSASKISVESYSDGTTYYRKYSDGWVEQGGIVAVQYINNSSWKRTVSLPIEMSTRGFTISLSPSYREYVHESACVYQTGDATTTTINIMTFVTGTNTSGTCYWKVEGYRA